MIIIERVAALIFIDALHRVQMTEGRVQRGREPALLRRSHAKFRTSVARTCRVLKERAGIPKMSSGLNVC
jgi:hypothetical protein